MNRTIKYHKQKKQCELHIKLLQQKVTPEATNLTFSQLHQVYEMVGKDKKHSVLCLLSVSRSSTSTFSPAISIYIGSPLSYITHLLSIRGSC